MLDGTIRLPLRRHGSVEPVTRDWSAGQALPLTSVVVTVLKSFDRPSILRTGDPSAHTIGCCQASRERAPGRSRRTPRSRELIDLGGAFLKNALPGRRSCPAACYWLNLHRYRMMLTSVWRVIRRSRPSLFRAGFRYTLLILHPLSLRPVYPQLLRPSGSPSISRLDDSVR